MSLTLKITSLFVRTLAKPLANTIKRNAREHERFRKYCIGFAQGLHRVDMRMRLGLLQDPAVIEKQIAKEAAAVEAARRKDQAPTVKTKEETEADAALTHKEREEIEKKKKAALKPRIRPLSEAKAIETGANFVAETFIFAVGIGVIVFEQWRQRRKARNQRDDIREDLEELQQELKAVRAELAEVKANNQANPGVISRLTGWGGSTQPPGGPNGSKESKEAIRQEIEEVKQELVAVKVKLEEAKARQNASSRTVLGLWKDDRGTPAEKQAASTSKLAEEESPAT
ncbi:optic atrophy 3 protein-domain-containing protein [Lophiotrema nucula]|uniref:Optic atrophy 3 protein-domain-containing protein n=1 Tax=Lophiotrema nucula TaxID=690887 RepID=A0A6A5ZHJ7_9PLEO|nr:optic atrophy 3 protein-domain-containing protein [Lophiotrema nucula]